MVYEACFEAILSKYSSAQTIAHFVAMLRKTTDGSKFYDSYDAIVDQVFSGCYDPSHRKEFLK